jgi:hypothetical protein
MKKLGLLLSALLVLSAVASSPVLASRPSFEYRIQSLLVMFYERAFPFSGVFIVPGEIGPINNDGSWGGPLGGDADDYGNGRGTGNPLIGNRESVRILRGFVPGLGTRDEVVSKTSK